MKLNVEKCAKRFYNKEDSFYIDLLWSFGKIIYKIKAIL